tara:strand:- start:204 stop:497 length:294 start_codon:yes stop_codon:yes gene_type:complete
MNVREYFKNKLGEPMSETYEDLLTGKQVLDIAQECVNEALNRAKNNVALDFVSCITPIDLTLPKHVKDHLELIRKLEDEMGVNCCKVLAIPPNKQEK